MAESLFKENMSRYLLGEMSPGERNAFIKEIEKSPENWKSFREYIILNDLLHDSLGTSSGKNANTGKTGILSFGNILNNKFAINSLSASGIAALLFISFFLYRTEPDIRVYTAAGECRNSEGKSISRGEKITSVRSGENSICDIRFNGGRDLTVRLYPDSNIELDRDQNIAALKLSSGMLQAKTGNSNHDSERVFLIVGKTTMEFMGTEVTATVKQSGPAKIEVTEGSLHVKEEKDEISRATDLSVYISESIAEKQNDQATVIHSEESLTITKTELKKETISKKRLESLKQDFSVIAKTRSDQNNVEKTNADIENILKNQMDKHKITEPFLFYIYLNNGEILKGNTVYHEGDVLIVEMNQKTLRLNAGDVKKVEKNENSSYKK